MWSDAIRRVVETLGITASFYSINGVTPFIEMPVRHDQIGRLLSEEKYAFDTARLHFIKKWKPKVVIIAARWSQVRESDATDLMDFFKDNTSKVLLVEQPPELAGIGNRSALQFACFHGLKPKIGLQQHFAIGNEADVKKGRQVMRQLAEKYSNCEYIPIYDLYARGSDALFLDGNQMVYLDDDHLTTYGSHLAIPLLKEMIADALRPRVQLDSASAPLLDSVTLSDDSTLNLWSRFELQRIATDSCDKPSVWIQTHTSYTLNHASLLQSGAVQLTMPRKRNGWISKEDTTR